MSGFLEMAALSAVMIGLVAWLCVALLCPLATGPEPGRPRAGRARLWLYGPLWVPASVLAVVTVPGLLMGIFGVDDHCVTHGGHGHHLCVLHPPQLAHHPIAWGLIALALLPALTRWGRAIAAAAVERRLSSALVRSSRPSDLGADVRLLDQATPIALTVGALRPVILLSTGLIEAISPQTLRIILAHERAHMRRRDTAWALLDAFAGALLPKAARGRLLGDLSLAREQACDLVAAQGEGPSGRAHVAAALTAVSRLGLARPACGMSAGAASIEARVLYLLDEGASAPRRSPRALICALTAAACLAGPAHTLIERIITGLLH